MKMTDILTVDEWVELEKELHERTGLCACAFDATGSRVTGYVNWPNDLCPVIKAKPESTSAICSVANQHIISKLQQSGSPVIEECDAGLVKIAVPVQANGEFVGFFGGCGLLPKGGEVDTFMVAKSCGIEESEAERLAQSCKVIEHSEAQKLVDEYGKRVNDLVAQRVG
jgi:ligand-binding sensor protein